MSDYRDAELVLGLVGPVGTDFDLFTEKLQVALKEYRYEAQTIRLATLANAFGADVLAAPEAGGTEEYLRLTKAMNAGNAARHAKTGDVLALAAAAQISITRSVDARRSARAAAACRVPVEVAQAPGGSVCAAPNLRAWLFLDRSGDKRRGAAQAASRAQGMRSAGDRSASRSRLARGRRSWAANSRHVSPGGCFPSAGGHRGSAALPAIGVRPPVRDADARRIRMFMAFSAALRSADLSRQVGAVVTSKQRDIIGVGANDVPIAGGGLHWPGPGDQRDHRVGVDKNEAQRRRIIDEILQVLAPEGVGVSEWSERGRRLLKDTAVMDITEFGRAVHAEMEALLSCARSGISPREGTLFSTTFPCHNCAKHILASGIARVVYVEPYPKSQAIEMYPESIKTVPSEDSRVLFDAFTGVGPRRFLDLFSIGLSSGYHVKRKEDGGRIRNWLPEVAEIRVPLLPNSYIVREQRAAEELTHAAASEEIKR